MRVLLKLAGAWLAIRNRIFILDDGNCRLNPRYQDQILLSPGGSDLFPVVGFRFDYSRVAQKQTTFSALLDIFYSQNFP